MSYQISKTPEKYKFYLLNPDSNEDLELKTPPIGWDDATIQIDRDIEVGGVFVSFVAESLVFIKEGAEFLRAIWDEKEMNGRCLLYVYYLKTPSMQYQAMPSSFSLNFSTARPRHKTDKQSIGFKIESVKNDILVKLENRRGTDVDVSKTYKDSENNDYIETIGGAHLIPFSQYPYLDFKKIVYFDKVKVDYLLRYSGIYSGYTTEVKYGKYTQFNMNFLCNDFEEASEVSYKSVDNLSDIDFFFTNSSENREFVPFFYMIEMGTLERYTIFQDIEIYIEEVDSEGESVTKTQIEDPVEEVFGRLYYWTGEKEIEVGAGNSLRLYIFLNDDFLLKKEVYILNGNFNFTQNIIEYPARDVASFPIYEMFDRVSQHITDTQFPFYSEFFGRRDCVYNLKGDTYSSQNQQRYVNIMTGLNLRGAALFDNNNPLAVSFDDLFATANALYSLGYQLETIDNFDRIRIENYSFFFDSEIVLDLSDRLKKYDIEAEALPDLAYATVESGFEDYTYEKINGRGEYNTESTRTSIMNTDTPYEITSPIRGDTMGIADKIAEELTSEDTEEDNELFILKTQRYSYGWKPEKQENITIEENSSLFGDDSFNLFFTPTRNLIRHGNRIKGAFAKFLQSFLKFQTSSKLQTLKTTGTVEGEQYTITENQDIAINDLETPIFKPQKFIVTCKFTFEDFEKLMENPKGLIKFSDDAVGYLLSLSKKNNEDQATIEIIEKYENGDQPTPEPGSYEATFSCPVQQFYQNHLIPETITESTIEEAQDVDLTSSVFKDWNFIYNAASDYSSFYLKFHWEGNLFGEMSIKLYIANTDGENIRVIDLIKSFPGTPHTEIDQDIEISDVLNEGECARIVANVGSGTSYVTYYEGTFVQVELTKS